MTITTDANDNQLLQCILSAQVMRNLNNTALVQKANSLPYCKKNIMLTMLLFWDKVFTDVTDTLVHHESSSKRIWDANSECLEYIKANNLANVFFAEFFFEYHQALTDAFLDKLHRELNNGMPYHKKFAYLTGELSELLNLACIGLEGLHISCETFGGSPLCTLAKNQHTSDCGQVDNVVCAMISNEHLLQPNLMEQTLDRAIHYFEKAKDEVIMVLDYRNLAQSSYVFGEKSRARYDKAAEVFKAVYLYHCDLGMTFGKEFEGLEKFVIPNKTGLLKVVSAWRERQEIVTFA